MSFLHTEREEMRWRRGEVKGRWAAVTARAVPEMSGGVRTDDGKVTTYHFRSQAAADRFVVSVEDLIKTHGGFRVGTPREQAAGSWEVVVERED